MRKSKKIPLVFFNASVILAALHSPKGGSAKLIRWCQENKIKGIINEIIVDEALRNIHKIGKNKKDLAKLIASFEKIIKSPEEREINHFKKVVIDEGDAHVITSSVQTRADFLATLDKKHLLVLQNKIKKPKIVSPKQLIEKLVK